MGRVFDWDRYENELDDGISTDVPKFDPVSAIVWCGTLVIGLAFVATVAIICWRLVTWMI